MIYKKIWQAAAPYFLLLSLTFSSELLAEVTIFVVDQDGAPLPNTAVVLTPLFELATQTTMDAMVDQIDE